MERDRKIPYILYSIDDFFIKGKKHHEECSLLLLFSHLQWEAFDKEIESPDFGALITTHRTLAKEMKISVRSIQRQLKELQKRGLIRIRSNSKYTAIFINKEYRDEMYKNLLIDLEDYKNGVN